jgi:excisionase family DNA binding protein
MTEEGPEYYTPVQAAEALGISKQRTYQLIAFGLFPGVWREGRNYRIPRAAVEARLAGNERLDSKNCVSAQEVADFFGTNVRTVREWNTEGLLPASRILGRLCFAPADVIAFIPRTYGSSGRYPARKPTRTLRGRKYPVPEGQQQPHERNPIGKADRTP